MFTGIITAVGQIKSAQKKGDGLHLVVQVPEDYLNDVALGDSIAIQGACMTATNFEGNTFALDISRESLNKTVGLDKTCLLYTSPSPRDYAASRMPSSA